MGPSLKVSYTIVETRLGWVVIGGSKAGLSFVTRPLPSREAALSAIEDSMKGAVEEAYAFSDLPHRLQRYFDSEKVTFPDKLDLDDATDFQGAVWNAARSIPYGETRSYAWVAKQIRSPRACRAVGGALARNSFFIIVPCHRVVASDGQLGGFGGGLEMKQQLLQLEAHGRLAPKALGTSEEE